MNFNTWYLEKLEAMGSLGVWKRRGLAKGIPEKRPGKILIGVKQHERYSKNRLENRSGAD
jgi:hypothetical protein